jgi:hypothetical protein
MTTPEEGSMTMPEDDLPTLDDGDEEATVAELEALASEPADPRVEGTEGLA